MADIDKNKVSEQEIYNYLMSKPGMTDVKAQGILANIKAESNFNPGIRGDYMIADPTNKLKNKERLVFQKSDGKYYYMKFHPTKAGQEVDASLIEGIESASGGLFQHQGSRYNAMVAEVGDNWQTNWKGQIDFALQEQEAQDYMNTDFTSVSDSTKAFMLDFEKPADQSEEAINKRIKGLDNVKINESNVNNKDLLQKVKGEGRFKWSNEFGGFIPEKEYNEKLNAGQIATKDPFYYNYLNNREKTLIKNFNSVDNAKDKLTVNKDIFAEARNKVFNKYAFDENGKERYGMKVNGKQLTDEQGAKLFTQDLYNQFAEDLGYDPENLQGYQKIHVSRYMSDFKKEITLAREGKYGPAGNMGINSYLSRLNIPARGIDPFLEDIVEDKTFSENYDRNYTDDWSELENALIDESKYLNKYKDLQGKSSKEIQNLIDNVPEVDTNLYGPTTKEYKKKVNERNKHIEYLKNIQNFNQNNPNAYSDYVKEGKLKVVDVENVEDLTQEQIEGRRAEETYDIQKKLDKEIILEEIGEEEELVEDDIINKDGDVDLKDTEATDTSLPDIVVERGLLDTIGGIGTAISALVGVKALKAANNPIETLDTPELSDAFKAELYQQEQMAKRGFSPEQEAQARQQISDAYSLGIENAVRGTAGDRAKFLAMSGVLDSRRQAALLDFAAKDEAAMRANQEQYRNTLMFKENFDQQQAQQLRNEELEIMQNQYSTNQMLGSQALKYAMDNINNAKADRMQNTLTQVMINDAAAGQNIVEKYNTGGLLGKFGKSLSGLLGMNNSENNTEDNGN